MSPTGITTTTFSSPNVRSRPSIAPLSYLKQQYLTQQVPHRRIHPPHQQMGLRPPRRPNAQAPHEMATEKATRKSRLSRVRPILTRKTHQVPTH